MGNLQSGEPRAEKPAVAGDETAFAPDNISIRWVQSAGSNEALEFLNAGSLDFGSTAGAAALIGKVNGNPSLARNGPRW